MISTNCIEGMLFGLAYGDAWGAPTEFMSLHDIHEKYPPIGPTSLEHTGFTVTDDTQMTLSVARAITKTYARTGTISPVSLQNELIEEYLAWYLSPENNRAPGMTCLSACEKLLEGLDWITATGTQSKGCGANMRVAPAAVLDNAIRAPVAQFQAAVTHGHATGLTASDLTAEALHQLLNGMHPTRLLDHLKQYANSQQHVYHQAWLGDLWQRPSVESATDYINRGWQECLAILNKLEEAMTLPKGDPCLWVGEGWIAEEAFAAGLLSFLWFPDEPLDALRRAATSEGDSDSIACLAGAFSGAHLGIDAFPDDWKYRIEYSDQLTLNTQALATLVGC